MKNTTILLQSVNWSQPPPKCKSCGKPIRWAKTAKGKNIALEERVEVTTLATGGLSCLTDYVHWAHCPNADQHRREARNAPSERID